MFKHLILGLAFWVSFSLVPTGASAQGPLVGRPSAGKIAVTPAGYDDMGSVLKSMGFSPEEIPVEDLSNLEKLKQYSAIYLNCSGAVESVAEEAASAVRQYVEEGGFLYASDFAEALIAKAFPGKIDFYNEGGYGAKVGNAGEVTAKVTDAGLAAALGANSIKVNFDLGAWVVMTGTSGRVYMRGPAPIIDYSSMTDPSAFSGIDFSNPQSVEEFQSKFQSSKTLEDVPYVVSFSQGRGEVLYTSFHNEAQTTADVSKVLNWFAVRTQASGIAQESRNLASSGEQGLFEVVDSIQKGETRTYKFNATGKAAFKVVLNFGGSTLDLKVVDPKGNRIDSKSVSEPPYTATVNNPQAGDYKFEVTAKDIPQTNYPFVLTVLGKAEAAGTQSTDVVATKQGPTGMLGKIQNYWWVGAIVLGVILVAILTIVMIKRKKSPPKPKETK